MPEIRCANCDQVVPGISAHVENRSSIGNGSVSSYASWSCTASNWRERAIKAEAELAALKEKKRKAREPKFEPIPDYGDHMTWESFVECVESGGFMDDDGSGDLATATQCSNRSVHPSSIGEHYKKPKWATHVVWYNK